MRPAKSGKFVSASLCGSASVKRLSSGVLLVCLIGSASLAQATDASPSLNRDRLEARHSEVREAFRDCERGLFLQQRDSGLQRAQADTLHRINQWFILFEQRSIERYARALNDLPDDHELRLPLTQLAEDWRAFLDCEEAFSN